MIVVLLYQCFAGFLAWWNYKRITNNKSINHFVNGALHIAASLLIGFFTQWNYAIANLFITRVVFDTVLNVLREKGLGYMSPEPASVVDQVESAIILWIARKVYKMRRVINDEDVSWVAIWFRVFVLGVGIAFLVI
jgi:hypothetical protein